MRRENQRRKREREQEIISPARNRVFPRNEAARNDENADGEKRPTSMALIARRTRSCRRSRARRACPCRRRHARRARRARPRHRARARPRRRAHPTAHAALPRPVLGHARSESTGGRDKRRLIYY